MYKYKLLRQYKTKLVRNENLSLTANLLQDLLYLGSKQMKAVFFKIII